MVRNDYVINVVSDFKRLSNILKAEFVICPIS